MISNKKNGLSVSLMATRVMPSLLPQTMNPSLSLDQFSNLLDVLQEMLDHIDRWFHLIYWSIYLSDEMWDEMIYLSSPPFVGHGRHQRNKLKLDNLTLGTSPERIRPLRHQHSTDNMHATGNFNIPYVKVEQRKTCSEENMIKTQHQQHNHSSSKLHGPAGHASPIGCSTVKGL